LLTIRANVMAGRALSMYVAMQLDISRFHPDVDARARAELLVALLIPVQKAYCTDRGFESCVLAQQVLGGHGYIAEWGLEQNVRDARIAQIYEGANGIQALDLAGRKTVRSKGELTEVLLAEIDEFISQQQNNPGMTPYLSTLKNCRERLSAATASLIGAAQSNPEEVGAGSYAYMELLGLSLYCFMWQRILASCLVDNLEGYEASYVDALIKTGEFFFARLLPKSESLIAEIEAGSASLMALSAEQF